MLTAHDRELRKGRITSSTAAAILGLSPWMTPLGAWHEIVHGSDDREVDEATAAAFERGHFLEPALLDWARVRLSREQGRDLLLAQPGTVVIRTHSWAADTVDGLLLAGSRDADDVVAALEAKSVAQAGADGWGEPGTAQVPTYVELQARIHMLAHEVPICYVPALVGSRLELRLYHVRRDHAIEQALIDTLGAWHHAHVVGGTPPAAQAGDEHVLRRLFPRHRNESMLPDDPAIASLVRADVELREEIRKAEASRDAVRCELMERLGDQEGCRGDWGSVTWRASADRTSVDYEAIVEALAPDPTLIERHTRVRPGTRVLRTTYRTPKGET